MMAHQVSRAMPNLNVFDGASMLRLKDIALGMNNSVEKKQHQRSEKDDNYKNSAEDGEIHIPEGEKPESYNEEHRKLLGDCEAIWVLNVDGCDGNGRRMYDNVKGKTCHQCRQKTLGRHTRCSHCKLARGKFCGDCLYMRYGENVLEVKENSKWVCPVCRGICNCSFCRRGKGWMPTGPIFGKVKRLGYKSVAHYLIESYCEKKTMKEAEESAENPTEEHGRGVGSSTSVSSNGKNVDRKRKVISQQ